MPTTLHHNTPHFVFPIDGDCVNERDGSLADGGLTLTAHVSAPDGAEVYINGKRAERVDGLFCAAVTLTGYRNTLAAEDRTSGTETQIAVYHMPQAVGKYRLSSDDNILFLQDITKNQAVYRSIFENPYLAVYKKAHERYGAKVHLNLFYEFKPEEAHFSDPSREYFNLSMMTDRFKDEFCANADWLKLAFHARGEFPNKLYQNVSAEEMTHDCLQVLREIVRFAGAECISDSTTVHWGAVSREGVRALRALGLRSLTGYFEKNSKGEPVVAYYTDGALCDHIGARDFWVDTDEDMIFGRIDTVLNLQTLDWVKESLSCAAADPHRGGFVSIMIHEQYFYPDYTRYLSDFEERVLSSCRYLFEKGYRGAHISEVTAEPHLRQAAALY